MKKIFYTLAFLILAVSINKANSKKGIALYNFSEISFDEDNYHLGNLSNNIESSFIDLVKSDLSFVENLNFIPTKDLEKKLFNTQKTLLDNIENDLRENIIRNLSVDKLKSIISEASKNNLSESQTQFIADSLMISISSMTKNITKDMMTSNTVNPDEPSEISLRDLYQFINNSTKKSIDNGTYSHFIASTHETFDVDIIIIGKADINQNSMSTIFYIYDYSSLKLIDKITASNSIDKLHILVKDIEFKLIDKLGLEITDEYKLKLCEFNSGLFSYDNYTLYFSEIFTSDDLKELKIRFQFEKDFDLFNRYYKSIFSGLVDKNIFYSVKFYDDDTFYQVYSTEGSSEKSVTLNFLNDIWVNRIGITNGISIGGEKIKRNSKIETNIDYSSIQAIQFKKDDSFNLIKKLSTYGLIFAAGFFVILLL